MLRKRIPRLSKSNKDTANRNIFRYVFVILVLITILFVLKAIFQTKHWSGDNRVTVAVQSNIEGDIVVVSVDPVASEIVNIVIPKDTEIEVAGNLGKWKIGKVWDLGNKEGRGGELLAKSITSYFGFPVQAWGSTRILMTLGGGINALANLFIPLETSLNFGDRVALTYFSLLLDNTQRTTINLKNTSLLKPAILDDGSSGYIMTSVPAPKIYSYFSDYHISKTPTRARVYNGSGNPKSATMVSKILQVMGGGVTTISKLEENISTDFICKVGPKDESKTMIISALFGCELMKTDSYDSYDVEIILGNKFSQYY